MNQRLRLVLNIVLSLVMATGVCVLLGRLVQHIDGAAAAEKAARTAGFESPALAEGETADPAAEELAGLDLAALAAVNPDVAGWIYIPGTTVSYPVLQGQDNDYYLRHTWERKWNSCGSIFLDSRVPRDFSGGNTIIYGHQMKNGTMFTPLHGYGDADFWREHPSIYVADGACVRRYEVFAAWEPEVTSPVFAADGVDRQELLALCLRSSQLDTGLEPGPEDPLLTLSTCTDRGHATRWVVQGVLAQVYPLS